MPFEWVVGDSSKDHTVTASMFYDVLATVRYTTLWGITERRWGPSFGSNDESRYLRRRSRCSSKKYHRHDERAQLPVSSQWLPL